jgi:vancomycin permeability regulator SanA
MRLVLCTMDGVTSVSARTVDLAQRVAADYCASGYAREVISRVKAHSDIRLGYSRSRWLGERQCLAQTVDLACRVDANAMAMRDEYREVKARSIARLKKIVPRWLRTP